MPFIMKITPETRIDRVPNYPVKTDPSVQINTYEKYSVFSPDTLVMHHYSMIRADIKDKFSNAAASIRWTRNDVDTFIHEYLNYSLENNPGIKYFGGRKIKEVPNYFSL